MQIGWMIAIVCMVILAVADIKEREVPIIFLMIFGVIAIVSVIIQGEWEWMTILYSLMPGAFLLAVSLCTRESIGYGDGWTVMILGLLIGAQGCFIAVCMGLILSAFFSVVLLALHKVNGKSKLPFLPFLAIGLGGWIIAQKRF